ncbi:major facilitator superfamily MFS_1 [Methylocella silvestris BL2]|uniref:Major facilitator superfamily MFS_1 n=1 Tax=Methylocella silvestris (strain DSM 15510 / CIP 108128 / LMG 27833 / NCIMB 13906 / BL2) TaxID=395965 RepID=B8ESD7_METSB|nr:MFS transporter [Methylocella silvestris]ACK49827.1 major facilitator superfamily MFS_1 [Methylocella silvestris BL2]
MSIAARSHAKIEARRARVGAAAWRSILVALTAFLTVVDLFATQAILPPLAHAYAVTPAAMGLAVNASTFGMAAASFAVAAFSHRIDRRRGVIMSLVALSVPTLLLAIAPNLAVFALLRIMQGLLMASAFTLTLAYLSERCSASDTASAFAAYIAGNVASNLFGRLLAAATTDHFGLATNFVLFACLNLAGTALVYFTVRRQSAPPQDYAPTDPASAIRGHLNNPALRASFGVGFCILFAFIGVFTFVNFVLVRPPISAGMMTVGFVYLVFLPSIATTLWAGRAVARLGQRRGLIGGLVVAAAGLPFLLTSSLMLVTAGLGFFAIGTFFAQAVATGFVGPAATGDRGAASGLYLACYFLGGIAGTATLGWIFDSFGWAACIGGVAFSLSVAALLGTRFFLPAHH